MTTGPSTDPLSLIGKTLAGHFLVQRLTAEGRTSLIYKGEHVGPKRPVALKCLKISLQLDAPRADTFLKRLREETRRYSQVARNEPHFVRSIGTGMTATSNGSHVPYSVLEWLDGFSLAQDLSMRSRVGEAPRSVEETSELLAPVARALATAHSQKVLHGDVGSNNIFLSQIFGDTTDVKVLDFGVSRVVRDVTLELSPSGSPPPTNDPFWGVSPGYAAPEQEDRSLGEVGTWSDVYALGVVFMETLAGKLIRNTSPLPRALGLALPETVEKVFERALMKQPKERWPSAGEFWAALEDSLRVSAVKLPSRPPGAAATPTAGGDRTIRILTPMQIDLVAATTPTPVEGVIGKATMRMGSPVPGATRPGPRAPVPAAGSKPVAPNPALVVPSAKPVVAASAPKPAPPAPIARTVKVDAKAEIKPDPKPEIKPEPKPEMRPPQESKPIIGTPVLMAQPGAPSQRMPPKVPERKPAPPLPDRKASAAPAVPSPSPAASADAPPPSSNRISAPPPPPAPGEVVPVAPGPVPAPPPSSGRKLVAAPPVSAKSPARAPGASEQKSVSAAAPAKSAGVFIDDLPSVIVEGGIPQLAAGYTNPRGADTIRLNPPQNQGAPQNAAPIQMVITSTPFAPQPLPPPPPPPPAPPMSPMMPMMPMIAPGMPPPPPGLPPPPLVARPGVIIMPPGAPPSPRQRQSFDERRASERKRIYLVIGVSFLVAFLGGSAFLLLHVMRMRGAPSAEAAPK